MLCAFISGGGAIIATMALEVAMNSIKTGD